MIGMKVYGVGATVLKMRQIGERVVSGARQMMHRSADEIVKEAKLNAPRDEYRLEESIHKEVGYVADGRLAIDIVAGGTIDGVNVDQYAALMHENYEDIISPDPIDDQGRIRRQGTIEKQRAHPERYVGGKFIERALEDHRDKLNARMVDAVTNAVED